MYYVEYDWWYDCYVILHLYDWDDIVYAEFYWWEDAYDYAQDLNYWYLFY